MPADEDLASPEDIRQGHLHVSTKLACCWGSRGRGLPLTRDARVHFASLRPVLEAGSSKLLSAFKQEVQACMGTRRKA